MIVLRTHIVYYDGYLQPLFECEGGVWFVQMEQEDLDEPYHIRLRITQVTTDQAKEMMKEDISGEYPPI